MLTEEIETAAFFALAKAVGARATVTFKRYNGERRV